MQVLANATVATMAAGTAAYGLIEDGALAISRRPHRLGRRRRAICRRGSRGRRARDLGGRLVTPALIDCHTHVVFGGDRAREFEMRLEGASYEEIARAGGGIVSTVRATRAADEAALLAARAAAGRRADRRGRRDDRDQVGLRPRPRDRAARCCASRARDRPRCGRCGCARASSAPTRCRRGRDRRRLHRRGLHPDAATRRTPRGWSTRSTPSARASPSRPAQIAPGLRSARATLGLPVKLHAEQLSNLGGARAGGAARRAVGRSPRISRRRRRRARWRRPAPSRCILPGAFYTLRETQAPPVAALRAARRADGGGDRLQPRHLADDLAAAGDEHGLHALPPDARRRRWPARPARPRGRSASTTAARIAPGLRADLAIWDVAHPAELAYRIGFNPLHARIFGGRP